MDCDFISRCHFLDTNRYEQQAMAKQGWIEDSAE